MREPKFKLNKNDDARWHLLLTRHCLDCPVRPVSHKYPPLTPAEDAEFEALCRKRSKKLAAHPRMQEARKYQRRHDRKIRRLLDQLDRLTARFNKT